MSTQRSSHWSLTINNPTASDYEQIELARQKGWKITGQQEAGKEGTPHLQLHLATPQVRFSAVKKTFPRAHIEVARNIQALENYVNKEESRTGSLPMAQEKYPSLSKFWHLIYQEICDRNWLEGTSNASWWHEANEDLKYPEPKTSEGKREFAMLIFDTCVGALIERGYHVDQFYSPPNMNLWKKFHFSILQRCYLEKCAQTSSQTDVRLIPDDSLSVDSTNASQDVS